MKNQFMIPFPIHDSTVVAEIMVIWTTNMTFPMEDIIKGTCFSLSWFKGISSGFTIMASEKYKIYNLLILIRVFFQILWPTAIFLLN